MQIDNFAFWGIFLILSGIALLIRVLFNLEIPVLKVVAGLFFILTGLSIIFGKNNAIWPFKSGENEIIFKTEKINAASGLLPRYNVLFSRTDFDLENIALGEAGRKLTINTVFSGSTLYISSEIPVTINVDAVFAGVKMPGRYSPVFGRGTYTSENFNPGIPHLSIEVNIVFGNVVFIERK
jgi:hypothetical protein